MTNESTEGPVAPQEGDDAGPIGDFWSRRRVAVALGCHEEAKQLMESAKGALSFSPGEAERRARVALRKAAEGYWHAEGLPECSEEHRYVHELGNWTRSTFGCVVDYGGSGYSSACPVLLADKRIGFSPGFLVRKSCSICDQDLSECPHLRDRMYWVRGGPTDFGACRVCWSDACSHDADTLYPAAVVEVIKRIDKVLEVSMVPVPSNPLARLESIPLDTAGLREHLGPAFRAGMPVSCDHCLEPYHGLPEIVTLPTD